MKIAILGTGAYGIAIALMANVNKNNKVIMWTKFEEEKNIIIKKRVNSKVLPNIKIPKEIEVTTDMKYCIQDSDLIMIMVPAGYIDDVSKELKNYYNNQCICIGSKGIEQDTCMFVADVVRKNIKTDRITIISGPSFAIDVASFVPIGLTVASHKKKYSKIVITALKNEYLKIVPCKDVLGTEICGSIKNIVAIAAGVIDGLGLPESTQAMLITEAMHDIKELINALGGNKKTILAFAGIGDLLLTCTSKKSRNFNYGRLIGLKSNKIEEYVQNTTIEGLYTLKSIHKLLKNKKVKMPIINIMYRIVILKEDTDLLIKYLINKK
ncbi:MAG: NAD(P)H-dependent glycerol-3-phosphate dehydrogenase [Prolixibacteraceae bacterium]|nr:NAD(P)H-dependent glycerol-3-phosphate dehydrogenase [Prolixibacteraceae bacterium]